MPTDTPAAAHTHTIESGNARVSVEADDAASAVSEAGRNWEMNNGGVVSEDEANKAAQEVASEAINDDVFNYEGSGGFSQCISGFGRNAVKQITERIKDAFTDEQGFRGHLRDEDRSAIAWHIEELVRWCRHFNGKSQELERERDALLQRAEAAERESKQTIMKIIEMIDQYGKPGPGGVNLCDGVPAEIFIAIGREHYANEYECAKDTADAVREGLIHWICRDFSIVDPRPTLPAAKEGT